MLYKNAVEPTALALLTKICRLQSLHDFALGGGTNLALRIGHRFSKKDFRDIAFLLKQVTLEEMLNIFKTKFPQIDTGFIIHSLTNFEDAEKEENPVTIQPVSWEQIKKDLRQVVISYTNKFL